MISIPFKNSRCSASAAPPAIAMTVAVATPVSDSTVAQVIDQAPAAMAAAAMAVVAMAAAALVATGAGAVTAVASVVALEVVLAGTVWVV